MLLGVASWHGDYGVVRVFLSKCFLTCREREVVHFPAMLKEAVFAPLVTASLGQAIVRGLIFHVPLCAIFVFTLSRDPSSVMCLSIHISLPLSSFPFSLSLSPSDYPSSLSPPRSMQLVQHVVSKPILRDKVELFQAGSLVLPAASLRMAAQLRTLGIFSDTASEVAELASRP